MKILALTGNSDLSESALIAGLARQGVGVHLIGTPNPRCEAMLVSAGVTVIRHDCPSRVHLSSISLIRSKLAELRPEIAHAFTNRMLSNLIIASAAHSVKRVAYRGTEGHISRLDPTAWLTYLNPGVHRISCVSEAVRRYLIRCGLKEEKLWTIYKGHDPSWYNVSSSVDLGEFGIPQGAFSVCCTANMRPVKGVDVLLASFSFLPPELGIHFLLVGEVRDRQLKKTMESLSNSERIHFTGFREDASAIAGKCSVFVMPSKKREGLPKAAIEAMAQGVPAIVSDVGGMPELVRDGVDGLVVPPSDPLALAAAIERLRKRPELRKDMGSSARERIKNDFNLQTMIDQTLRMYGSLQR